MNRITMDQFQLDESSNWRRTSDDLPEQLFPIAAHTNSTRGRDMPTLRHQQAPMQPQHITTSSGVPVRTVTIAAPAQRQPPSIVPTTFGGNQGYTSSHANMVIRTPDPPPQGQFRLSPAMAPVTHWSTQVCHEWGGPNRVQGANDARDGSGLAPDPSRLQPSSHGHHEIHPVLPEWGPGHDHNSFHDYDYHSLQAEDNGASSVGPGSALSTNISSPSTWEMGDSPAATRLGYFGEHASGPRILDSTQYLHLPVHDGAPQASVPQSQPSGVSSNSMSSQRRYSNPSLPVRNRGRRIRSPTGHEMGSRAATASPLASRSVQDEVIVCGIDGCTTTFTKGYRRGSHARHMRSHHDNEGLLCEAGCGRCYKRSDARLKHYRKHHPHLASPSKPRK
ncbi:hypothetical protein BU24DRAFT_110059 [Aaosphaeria arxii CBS 175.79]|uniref:C2H2-type domain-containing protein n=1 Tax=Aaosphaeria arxii CBS 175.79 TaxID=1450172 RepID=A0A6A5Y176_9PLEO|nr:uncharacterized protein BU24DRAFT_110059 [Aaosphaeria arxii CBS 175.79]KAF2018996.1 hypothetical protein BU24DRAFT_110059 [Aaosphaeria arxii CBS 175.79]